MALIRKLLVLLALGFVALSSACKEESAKQVDTEIEPSIADLLQSIENVELAEARGLALTSASPDTVTIFKRILNRSKAAAGLLRTDAMNLTGLTELVRSRDELRNLTILTEDVNTIGIYRSALEKAVAELAILQGVRSYELADPNVYHELYAHTFNLTQKLGDFASFVEMADAKGPKLFEAGTCGDVCGNAEYVVTDVDKNQAVWVLSPTLSLPDVEALKLTVKGYVRGSVHDSKNKGFRLYVSEVFDGRFTAAAEQWTDITSMLDPYLPTDKAGYFTSHVELDQFRGKSVTFAIRVQGLTNSTTMYQLQNFTVLGKGRAAVSNYKLVAPEPLMFKEQAPEKEKEEKPASGLPACLIADGKIDVKQSCRVAFDAPDAFNQLLVSTSDMAAPFRKYNFDSGKGFVESSKAAGWKVGSNCSPKPLASSLQTGLCVQRSAIQARDLLVSPSIKLNGNTVVKIQYAVVGPTLNKLPGDATGPRLRVLLFETMELMSPAIEMTDMAKNKVTFNPSESTFDIQVQGYPGAYVSEADAALSEMILDPVSLQAKIGSSEGPFRLALLQSLEGQPLLSGEAGQTRTTVWHVYSIDFIKAD
jgi:hypothetical protein